MQYVWFLLIACKFESSRKSRSKAHSFSNISTIRLFSLEIIIWYIIDCGYLNVGQPDLMNIMN